MILKVCGFEVISPKINEPKEIDMVKINNKYFEVKESLKKYFVTSDLACPVENFTLTNEQPQHDKYVWLDDDMNLNIDTSLFKGKGNITFSLQAISHGRVSGLKDFVLFVHNKNAPPTF